MPASLWEDFRIAVTAGIIVDKLVLAKEDTWALAARLSSDDHPVWTALLWSVPQLGSSQFMAAGYPMGDPGIYGVVVGDGQKVSSLNPVLVEWLFGRRVVSSGSCVFATVNLEEPHTRTKWNAHKMDSPPTAGGLLATLGFPLVVTVLVMLLAVSSKSYRPVLFVVSLYIATTVSNLYLVTQSRQSWAGYTKDREQVCMLILAPGDRWAVLSGPRSLVKTITTGAHTNQTSSWLTSAGQYLLVMVVLSAAFLEGATKLDAACIALTLLVFHIFTYLRTEIIGRRPTIRGVRITYANRKEYTRRAEIVSELSEKEMSDAWAYESGLLTRRYISPERKIATDA